MRLSRADLVRLGAVHAVGLGALAFATPAHATDEPPPPVVRAAVVGLTFELPDEVQPSVAAALNAVASLVDQENPANMPPPASATTQADTVGQSLSQAISPTYAQESPERASTNESQHPAVSAPSDEPQYHPRHVQYQPPPNARRTTPRLVLPTAAFSSREPTRITPSSSSIESQNGPRNGVPNCSADPADSWSPDLPSDSGATLPCTPEPPADEATSDDPPAEETTSDDPPDTVDCEDAGPQYQPDETQYQSPTTTCDSSDDSVVPISEPEPPVSNPPPVSNTSESAETEAPASVVSPTAEPVAAPTAPDSEPTQSGTDVLPAPDSSQPASTKVAGGHLVGRPSSPRFASSRQQARTERVIPALARSVSPSVPVRSRPPQARSTKPKTSIARRKIEAAPRSLEPASSRVSLFGDWVVLTLALSSAFALGLLLVAVALIAGRSLRARVGSKGLSDDHLGASRRGGIRYRE
jgi:hypothetical protein